MKTVHNLIKKSLSVIGVLMPFACLAQVTITGRVLNQADTKPIASASVFLDNTTRGDKATPTGVFTIQNVKPGKYELVVSVVGYETYEQPVIVGHNNLSVGDITITPKTISLNDVKVTYHADPNRWLYLDEFTTEFLGTSYRSAGCKILNPEVLNFINDDATGTLTANTDDFLEIENDALGYKINYKVTNFSFQKVPGKEQKVFMQGQVLFEEMKGSPAQQNTWEAMRQEAYQNSSMHFLRSALAGRLAQEGFRVQEYAIYANPARAVDSLINEKIKFYKSLQSPTAAQNDSLSAWKKMSRLPKTLEKMMPWPLDKKDIIETTTQPGVYQLGCDNNPLLVAFNKEHHYHISDNINNVYGINNRENTLIKFNGSNALFDGNGVIFNLGAISFAGVWGWNRVAELLPYDYSPPQNDLPENDDDHIIDGLENYIGSHPTEKAYLQFDKPYYAAGDTIYFKAYLTKGGQHKLSDLSGILHIDLINTKNKIDRSIKLQLDSGITWGDFALPDTLPAGNYRVRAYTQWMRNDGERNFFDKMIPIGSAKAVKIPESALKQTALTLKPDIQFFPEGGSLVAGNVCKVAFKAIGPNGLGLDVTGSITDNDNKKITSFASSHLGMGYFSFVPAEGKSYSAKINYGNGQQDIVTLPKAEPAGITLAIDNDALPIAAVTITANAAWFQQNRGKTYPLVIYSQESATTVNCKLDSPTIKLDILKRKLHTGVATVTLFSPENEPIAERLLFIQNYDALNLGVSSDKPAYGARQKVNIKLSAINRKGDPAAGHFSVSVIDESKVAESDNNNDNILTNLLLTSDVKGYIEQPAYYFSDTSSAARKNLDVLMLTQGFRRFEWKQVLDSAAAPIKFQLETSLAISGRVDNMSGKPVVKGTVTLIPSKGAGILSDVTDEKGLFRFSNLAFTDTAHFVLSAVNSAGQNSTRITYFNGQESLPKVLLNNQTTTHDTDARMAAYVAISDRQHQEVLISTGKITTLNEVKIKARRPEDPYRTQSLAGAGNADQVLHSEDIGTGPSLSAMLNGKLHGIVFINHIPILLGSGNMSVYVDGVKLMIDPRGKGEMGIDMIDPGIVETVEVLKYSSASIYGMDGGHGVLVITTKQGGGLNAKDIVSTGVLPVTVMGFYKARTFYSPKYDTPAALPGKERDLRSTIYWNPEIQTDTNGNASLDFYNADGAGTYKVTVEGIDKDGNIGRQVYSYQVK